MTTAATSTKARNTKTSKPKKAKASAPGSRGRNDSDSQHMKALAKANEVRLARAALKRQIASGEIAVAEVLNDYPSEAEGMTVSELLASQRRWGRTRSRKLLSRLDLTENKRIGTLTERQLSLLTAALNAPSA